MIESFISATYKANIREVWNMVTDNKSYSWRSDLSRIEIQDSRHFVEYARNGFPTYFTITAKKVGKRYEFDIENKNLKGHWIGVFTELPDGGTRIDFTEKLHIKNPLMRVIAKRWMPVKKIQKKYAKDLAKALKEHRTIL